VVENHTTAVLRWQDFVDKVERNREVRRSLGEERTALVLSVAAEPANKQRALERIKLTEARRAIDPPPRLVQDLMQVGMTREEAEQLVADVKARRVAPDELRARLPHLPGRVLARLTEIAGVPPDGGDGGERPSTESVQVGTCLEAILRLARPGRRLPRVLRLERYRADEGAHLELSFGPNQITVSTSDLVGWDETVRRLSTPAAEASEVPFQVSTTAAPGRPDLYFSLPIRTHWLAGYAELWPDEAFWQAAGALDTAFRGAWDDLRRRVATTCGPRSIRNGAAATRPTRPAKTTTPCTRSSTSRTWRIGSASTAS
jgi:hypothetical protein